MSTAELNFKDYSKQIAIDFIQTVVTVDDMAYENETKPSANIKKNRTIGGAKR